MNRTITAIGVVLIATGIILGAFGAHSLKELLSADKLTSFETGVRYQFYQGITLLIIGLNADRFKMDLKWFFRLNFLGTLFFSGSIYLLAIQELVKLKLSFLWPVTPVGGLLMIVAWCILFVHLLKKGNS